MAQITFADVCGAFQKHSKTGYKTPVVNALLRLITKQGVLNEKGNSYEFDRTETKAFFDGTADIYPNIRKAAANPSIIKKVEFDFEVACDDLLEESKLDVVYDELIKLIKQDESMDKTLQKELFDPSLDLFRIGPKVLIYALGNNNKTKLNKPKSGKTSSITDTINNLKKVLSKLPRPVAIEVPDEITETEMVYVTAILEAFAEDAGVEVISSGELIAKQEYQKYREKLARCRRDYYDAEEIRESLKDTRLALQDDEFEKLKEEEYNAVIDVVDMPHSSSMVRMNKVLIHATQVPLSSLIAQIPNWVGSSQKKGICHMLVNEERFRWKS